ncbi:MAG TPA: Ig-like domain-containing protein [Thermoanaerobaculia bacterium]|nr:Ig-like domain-containing protein [Thermoanaerobaculia bacterium]
MIRRLSLVLVLALLAFVPAAVAQTSVPDAPFYTRTVNIPAGQTVSVDDTLVHTACDPAGTRYEVVVRNGNPDGSNMVVTAITEIDGFDMAGDPIADGAPSFVGDTFDFQPVNTVRLGGTAPAGSAAVIAMEIWRKPISSAIHSQTYTFPQATTNKQFTASFAATNLTDRATLVITRTGGLQAADQFTISLNGTSPRKTKADFTATTQTRVFHVTLNATNSLVVEAVAASQASTVTVKVYRHVADTVAPAIAFTGTVPTVVGTSTYTFNGTVTDARGIASLTLNGESVPFSATNGAFTKAVTLTHGAPNTFTFIAYDCTGKGTKAVKTITWDRDAPVVLVTSPPANSFTRTTLAVDGTATDDTGTRPVVKVNGTTAQYSDATRWRATITLSATPEGPRNITVVATDAAAHSTTVTHPVVLDSTLPTITAAISPAPTAEGWSPAGATVTFTCNDSASGIQLCMPMEPVAIQHGRYGIKGTAIDRAGNMAILNQAVKGDGLGPELGYDQRDYSTQPAYVLTGNGLDFESGLATVTCNGIAGTVSGENFTCTVPLVTGPNAITIIGTDKVGNETREEFTAKLDEEAPQLTIASPADGAYVGAQVTVSGTASDNDHINSVKVNGNSFVLTDGEFSTTVALTAGSNTIIVEAKDGAGNVTIKTVTVVADAAPPTITATLTPPPGASGWNAAGATVTFTCNDEGSGIASCSDPVTLTETGVHPLIGIARDNAGNQATTALVVRIDAEAPQLTLQTLPDAVKQSPVTISGSISDALSDVATVECEGVAATLSGSTFTCTVPLVAGSNWLVVTAADNAGNRATATRVVILDQTAPVITIAQPADQSVVNTPTVRITGSVADDDQLSTFRIGGASVTPVNGQFDRTINLTQGSNTILFEATDRAGNSGSAVLHVSRYVVPTISITSPKDLVVLRNTTVTVTGVVSDPTATVDVNGVTAAVNSSGTFTANGVALQQGRTVVTANATSPSGGTATTSINVYRDSIPPRLQVYSPEDGAIVYAWPISISGMVDDIVVGTINSQQMRVTVNGQQATVSNRAWLLSDVALAPGPNTLLITATDEGGNATTVSYTVTLVVAPPKPHLEIVSGNSQAATIGTLLPAPVVVRAINSDGTPVANAPLTFSIIDNDGLLTAGDNTARAVSVSTDAQGQASARWTLGHRAGAGNNRLSVSGGATFAAPIEATAAGAMAPASLIVVDSGNNQYGIASDTLPRPLVAIVVDAGNNRLANVPVTFNVTKGGGSFDGQPSLTVQTDSDGRAIARPTLGPDEGEDNNTFAVSAANVTQGVSFTASGRTAKPAAATSVTGVILDNTTIPIAGVSVRIDGTSLVTQTNAQGQFTLSGVPVGYVKLFVDGSTAQRSGTWPTLEYALYTLPGVANDIGMPIYLVEIDNTHSLFVDDTTGGTLTLPELPGFALKVAPGAATFPGGGRTGHVSVTLVHADRMPMAPGFGQQPKFIVTIQPAGTHFDPPAQLTLPNVDGMAPGEVTEMYSFDHDLGQFVAIGTASVSKDGATITSDPGVGIIKGGWHCGGNPSAGGTGAHCGECLFCDGEICKPDPAQEGATCQGVPCKQCRNGVCTGITTQEPSATAANVTIAQVPPTWTFTGSLAANYGGTVGEDIQVSMSGRCNNGSLRLVLKGVTGQYSTASRIFANQSEPTGTTQANFCDQARALWHFGNCRPPATPVDDYYMVSAVQAHENAHVSKLLAPLQALLPQMITTLEYDVPMQPGDNPQTVLNTEINSPGFKAKIRTFTTQWQTTTKTAGDADDQTAGSATYAAEYAVLNPRRQAICAQANTNSWGACTYCAANMPNYPNCQ